MGVSVLLSVFRKDRVDYLDRALESVCEEQTRRPDQVVIVKDGPIGGDLHRVVERWSRLSVPAFTVLGLEENSGLGAALSAGLANCCHELVARMDADDVCVPQRLERQEAFLDAAPDIDIVGTGAVEIDVEGAAGKLRHVPESHEAIFDSLWTNPFIHPSVMFRRERVMEIGGYKASLRRRQDYELWFRAAEAGLRFANIDEPLLRYRFNRNTHKKQTPSLAFEQAMVGFRGASRLRMAWWKRIGCFVPFGRALLPSWAQHLVYRGLSPFDPRKRA